MAIKDTTLIVIVMFILGFIVFNVDPSLANAFWVLLGIYIVIRIIDKVFEGSPQRFPLEKSGNNRFQSLLITAGAYFGFLLVSSVLLSFTKILPGSTINSVMQLFSQSQPILKDSLLLTVLSFGFVIPVIETLTFFGAGFEFLVDRIKKALPLSLTNPNTWAVIILIASGFVIFHLQAKLGAGAQGLNSALILVFLFAITSLILVIITGQLFEAVMLHIVANTVSISIQLQVFTNVIYTVILIAAFVFLFMVATRRIKNISFT